MLLNKRGNTVSPISSNYLKLKNKRGEGSIQFFRTEISETDATKVTFEVKHLSDRIDMLLDLIFDKTAKMDNAFMLRTEPNPADIISFEQFNHAIQNPSQRLYPLISVSFTSTEFRKKFGIRITDIEIQNIVEELENTRVVFDGVRIWYIPAINGRGGHHKKITYRGQILDSTLIEETNIFAPRTKSPQHKFIIILGLAWSLIFRNDILHRRFGCFPKGFYQISRAGRALGRFLSCWPSSTLKINQMSEIMGYDTTSNLRKRKVDIEKRLEELKTLGIVRHWERAKKKGREMTGIETAWNIKMGNANLVTH